jgi:hypothetical protein
MNINNQFTSYESEFTQFINKMKQQKPELEAKQRAGRNLLWDKEPIALDEQARTQASAVKQQAYVYQNKG